MSRQLLHRRYFGPFLGSRMAQFAQTTFVSIPFIASSFLPRFIGDSPVGEHGKHTDGEHTDGEPKPGGDVADTGLYFCGGVTHKPL